jgi:hypothetical protein
MKIDIEKLTEQELLDLNRKIVERLKFLALQRTHKKMMEFSVGDKVNFQPPDQDEKKGVIVKYNKKTVTVVTEDGETWNVAPQLLSKMVESNEQHFSAKIMQLKKKRGA